MECTGWHTEASNFEITPKKKTLSLKTNSKLHAINRSTPKKNQFIKTVSIRWHVSIHGIER